MDRRETKAQSKGKYPLNYYYLVEGENQHQIGLRIVKRLIEAGADPRAKDAEGRTALDFVREGESPLVANYLKQFVKSTERQRK